jgi:DNA-binding response OmpR family regulator
VLVVDDDPSIRGMVRSVLRREGYDVEVVGTVTTQSPS